MRIHPHSMLLQELAENLTGEYRKLFAHALRCADCQEGLLQLLATQPNRGGQPERLAKILAWEHPSHRTERAEDDEYEPAFAASYRECESRLAQNESERERAPALLAELLDQPPGRRELLLANQERFHTWGVLELLVESCREESYTDASGCEERAWLALKVADGLDAALYGAKRIEDLRGRAWAYIANARRVRSDHSGAQAAFEQAFLHLKQGTRESLDRAIVLDLKASLLRDQRRFEDAIRLLRRAYRIFRDFDERHRAGRVLVNLSTVCHCAGQPEEAIPLLQEALDLVDFDAEPRLRLIIIHNLLDDLAEAGRFLEAREIFSQATPLYDRFPDASIRNRRKWVQGKIAHGLGHRQQAEVLLKAARDGFVEEGIAYDAALVSLDLAALYAEERATAELKRLSQEMLVIFRSQQIHREALAALSYLRQALEAEQATLDLIRRIATYLKRAESDPELRFMPGELQRGILDTQ